MKSGVQGKCDSLTVRITLPEHCISTPCTAASYLPTYLCMHFHQHQQTQTYRQVPKYQRTESVNVLHFKHH